MQTTRLITVWVLVLLAGCRSVDPRTIYADGNRRGVCPVHHLPMTSTRVPLGHGYLVGPGGGPESKVVRTQFPFAQWFLMDGGPIIVGEPPKDTMASYLCPRCQKAKLAWIEKNPDSQWAKEQLADYSRLQEFRTKSPQPPSQSARTN